MSEIYKTNVCCFDLGPECINYLKSLDLNVYEGSLGSVFSVKWGHGIDGTKQLVIDVDIPVNLHEYHVIIADLDNPRLREYKKEEHEIKKIESGDIRHLECCYPVNQFDLRPFGTQKLAGRFRDNSGEKRIEIIFVGHENKVKYTSNTIGSYSRQIVGTFSNIEGWRFVSGKEKLGKRVKLEDNRLNTKQNSCQARRTET